VRIHAYSISDSVDTKLCTDTVKAPTNRIKCLAGAVLQSDGSSAYQSYAYKSLLEELDIRMSLGKTGICYFTAERESLNGVIKTECIYCRFNKSNVRNRRISKQDIIPTVKAFIEFYNTERPKKQLGFLAPIEFRLRNPKGTYPVVVEHEKGLTEEKTATEAVGTKVSPKRTLSLQKV
jgi:transposase InsO family protein